MELLEYLKLQKSIDSNFTMKKFAAQCGIAKEVLSRIANKKQKPSFKLALLIQKLTNHNVSFLQLLAEDVFTDPIE